MRASASGSGSTGSTLSFASFYAAEAKRLVATFVVIAGTRHVAEDVVAEAFVRAYERWPRVSRMESPSGWIYRVAMNLLRRRRRREALEQRLLRRVPPADPQVIEIDPDLWAAVEALPPRARAAVGLRYVADLTEREVAEVLEIAPGTVAATLHDARRRLAQQIAGDRNGQTTNRQRPKRGGTKQESDRVSKPSPK